MPNNHIQESQYHEYLDEALDEVSQKEFEMHVNKCQECRKELTELRQLFMMIESVPESSLRVDLSSNILDAIRRPTSYSRRLKLAIAFQLAVAFTLIVIAWPILNTWSEYFEIPLISLDIKPLFNGLIDQVTLHTTNLSAYLNTFINNLTTSSMQFQMEEFSVFVMPLMGFATLLWIFGNGILLRRSSITEN